MIGFPKLVVWYNYIFILNWPPWVWTFSACWGIQVYAVFSFIKPLYKPPWNRFTQHIIKLEVISVNHMIKFKDTILSPKKYPTWYTQGSRGPGGKGCGPLKIQWGPCEILPEGPMDPQNWKIGNVFQSEWETKFPEHSPENRCPLYVLYKIPLAQANLSLAQLKMHSHWRAGER